MDEENEDKITIEMPVRMSAVSTGDGGIARIHISHMDMFQEEEPMATISNEKKSVVVKVVADKLAPEGSVTLREKDIDQLDVSEGDTVTLEPYSKLTDELKEGWEKFKARFKKDDEEEGEE